MKIVYELLLIGDSGIVPHVFMWHIIPWQQMHGLANAVMRLFTHLNIHFINKFYHFSYKKKFILGVEQISKAGMANLLV